MPQARDHAVVLGASMAGLLTARVLADAYRKVTIMDRDDLPDIGVHRRSVPHGRHHHALQPSGCAVLEELFPGFTAQVARAGAGAGDMLRHCRWLPRGHRLQQAEGGVPGLIASRPFLEGQVRARVQALPGVTFLEGTRIVGLATTAGRSVTGVHVRNRIGDPAELAADLVVDATGRGSRTPVWLTQWGYQPPAEERIQIGLGAATRTYRLRPGALGSDAMIHISATPNNPRIGVLGMLEGGRHMLTLAGIRGHHPPSDPVGFETFAASLPFGDISQALAGAQALDDPVAFRFPAAVRRRYEDLRQFPDGLLVLGDAVCSFNPVYGQGMAVAANQALVLRRLLGQYRQITPGRYFRAIAKVINPAWDFAVSGDLALPDIPGTRSSKVRIANAYLPRLLAAAGADVALSIAYIRVVGLIDRPVGLLRPDRMLRIWRITRQKTEITPARIAVNSTRNVVARQEVSPWH
jgi:2-polyprenyl-6-methoxyphenol hydroxylase-like FAD-dependent oxidoreductase